MNKKLIMSNYNSKLKIYSRHFLASTWAVTMPMYSTDHKTFAALNVSVSTKQRLKMSNGPLKLFSIRKQ